MPRDIPRFGRAVIFVAIFLCTTGFDQASKDWAHSLPTRPAHCAVPADLIAAHCAGVREPVIEGYWDWELAMNTGVAFSTLQDLGGARVVLSLLALVALVVIGITAARTKPEEHMKRVALALIAGGALGNLIDRAKDGAVTDFVRWHVHEHMWPIFNVADAALGVGVVLLLIESALAKRRRAMLSA